MTITEATLSTAPHSSATQHSPTVLTRRQRQELHNALGERMRIQRLRVAQAVQELDAFSPEDSPSDRAIARETLNALLDGAHHLDRALGRAERSDYGLCQTCTSPIPFERLEAIPDAVHCVSCTRAG